MHYNNDDQLLNLCKEKNIAVQAWAPLGRGRVLQDVILQRLSKKYFKTTAQIALRWIFQHGCISLPSSLRIEHMRQNKQIFDFSLSPEEMNEIDTRAKSGSRERVFLEANLGFTDEFDFSYEECWPK